MKAKALCVLILMGLGLCWTITGCGGGQAAPPPPPLPSIVSLSPTSATAGQSGFTLTVNGSNFVSGATVQWNGGARATTFVSSAQLTAAISTSDVAMPGSTPVSVQNPGPNGLASTITNFKIDPANPTAVINSFSPARVLVGGPDFTMTVNGSSFVSGAIVQWNGSNRSTSFVSSTQLSATITATDIAKSGLVQVTVLNPLAFVSFAAGFLVANPTPVINSISPSNAIVGGQGFVLTANGSGFVSQSVIQWDGNSLATTFVSNTQLAATVPAANISCCASQVTIQVVNPNAVSPSQGVNFELDNPKPTLTSLSPPNMMAGAAPFTLTVNGSGFVSGATVQWNGTTRPTQFLSSTQMAAAIAATDVTSQGTAQVTAVNPAPNAGPSAPTPFTINAFTSNPLPSLGSLSDTSAPAGWPGFPLAVNGTNFVGATSVLWNGLNRPTDVLNSTQVKGAIPGSDLATAGTAQVGVSNPSPGGGTSSAVNFTIKSVASGAVGVIERSSVATNLTEADADSGSPAISADGRFVLFTSNADNLVPGGTNGATHAFLRDSCIGAPTGCTPSLVRVSIATDGSQANQSISGIAISGNGRYVAFTSASTNLVPGGTSGTLNVFLHDTCLGAGASCTPTTILVSPDLNDSFSPALSSDGRYVTFTNGITGVCDYYSCFPNDYLAVIRDTCLGAASGCTVSTTTVSLSNDGSKPNDTNADPGALISADGRYVAFRSAGSNLVTDGGGDGIFLRDTCNGASACAPTTFRAVVGSGGEIPLAKVVVFAMSGNGRFVGFTTNSTVVVPGSTNGFFHVYVRDTCVGASASCIPSVTKVSLANDGSQASGDSYVAAVSADGRVVAFTSDATNLVSNDTSPFPKVFIRDTCSGVSSGCTAGTLRLSVALDGTPANNQSQVGAISANGSYVVFSSLASNLGPGDSNQVFDVFLARTGLP
jgi:hypothetical protein